MKGLVKLRVKIEWSLAEVRYLNRPTPVSKCMRSNREAKKEQKQKSHVHPLVFKGLDYNIKGVQIPSPI